MGSKKIKIVLAICLAFMTLCGAAGCRNMNRALEDCVSELHETVLCAEDDAFYAEVIGGKIEDGYALDGVKNALHDFVAVKINVKSGKYDEITAEFQLKNKVYTPELTPSPSDNDVWTAVIDETLPVDTLALKIVCDGTAHEFQLQKASSGEVKPLDVLKEQFEDKLYECYKDGKFNCEVSVRLVRSAEDGKYYWYTVVYKPDKSYFGIMLDSADGKIVAKKS